MANTKEGQNKQRADSGSTILSQAANGPPVYVNWIAAQSIRPVLQTVEFRLLTDAQVTGEAKQGPYQFLNAVPRHAAKVVQAAILMRVDIHIEFPPPDMTKTDADRYHAGSFQDEVAALSSLALGVRFKAGGVSRSFEPGGDPKGRPHEWDANPVAEMVIRSHREQLVVASAAEGSHPLDALSVLGQLPRLSAPDAVALVRAARLYQDALWLVESEPELAWLMLVSAVETAANRWGRSIKESAVERLKDAKPKLHQILEGVHVPGLVEIVAEEIADSLGSTRKFIDFVMRFLPPPPGKRPPEAFQFPWDQKEMRKALGVIYDYRSKALHKGIAFPYPMCTPHFRDVNWTAPSERPVGMATSAGGGTWVAKDTPLLLHVFEYIARNSLLGWWRESAGQDKTAAA